MFRDDMVDLGSASSQGRNRKIDKDRVRYGPNDPINRMIGKIDGMTLDEALAWMSVIDGCSPDLKAALYCYWSDTRVDVGLVQNSCYVACLPCQWDRYIATFDFFHEQAHSEGIRKISAEFITEEWIREHLDVLIWG